MCIEDLLEISIIDALMRRFRTKDREATIDVLWLRTKTIHELKFVSEASLAKQIASELHLPVTGAGLAQQFKFRGSEVFLIDDCKENSIVNITASWLHELFRMRRLENGTTTTGLAMLTDIHKAILQKASPKKEKETHSRKHLQCSRGD